MKVHPPRGKATVRETPPAAGRVSTQIKPAVQARPNWHPPRLTCTAVPQVTESHVGYTSDGPGTFGPS